MADALTTILAAIGQQAGTYGGVVLGLVFVGFLGMFIIFVGKINKYKILPWLAPFTIEIFKTRAGGQVVTSNERCYPVFRGKSQNFMTTNSKIEFSADQDEIWPGNHFKRQLKDGRLHPIDFRDGILISRYAAVQDQIYNESIIEALAKTQKAESWFERNKEVISVTFVLIGALVVWQIFEQGQLNIQQANLGMMNDLKDILKTLVEKVEPRGPVYIVPQSNFTNITVSTTT